MISSDAARPDDKRRPRPGRPQARGTGIAMGLAALALTSCAAGIKRDLSAVPVGQVGYDDLCGLQSYFDAIAARSEMAPEVIDAADIEGRSRSGLKRGGRARFAFETDFQLATVRRVLEENWKNLPSRLGVAHHIEINVNWSERAGVQRVANDSAPELVVDGVAAALPYHVCLSELLFGEPLYRQRREMLGLVPQPAARALEIEPHDDAGVPDGPVALPAREARSAGVPSSASAAGPPAAGPPAGAHPTVTGKKD